ncbi:MAG TPA: NAD(P)-binding domain-containing protein [Candidatus Dormibacteraeota bacterium]|nr:NAD(P)-binding domain-containing protein [Candidatus Dormibacteraeota bacterium]
MREDVNVAIIGAGQAGLSTSWFLKQANVDHVVLEAGRVFETWRSRRWDSFCLVTPNWSGTMLPGAKFGGDLDGFMPRNDLVAFFEDWARSFDPPLRAGCSVSALDADEDGFMLTTADGVIRARTVVVASGGYQRPHRPANSGQLPEGVAQLITEEYRNPSQLDPGGVLIVGSGQTGCQLAEELHQTGRKVILSCGRAPWAPRRMGDHDLVWWLVETGFADRTIDMLPSPAARLLSNPITSGHGGGHDLHLRTLHAMGVELIGRYLGADGNKLIFADDLAQSTDAGDELTRVLMKWVTALCEKKGMPVPWEVPEPMRVPARTQIDVADEAISTVIWTTGFRPDYGWVHFPIFDDMGFPIQKEGRSSVPGLYFMGVHFQRKARSATLYGVRDDAEIVAAHIAENRR